MTDIATKIYNILVNDEDGKLAQEVANVLAQRIAKGLEESEPEKHIIPAEPLIEPLEFGERYYCVVESGDVDEFPWHGDSADAHRLKDKNVFPYRPEGKAGADLRAKVPHPGIHWIEDMNRLKSAFDAWESVDDQSSYMISEYRSTVLEIINKYAK